MQEELFGFQPLATFMARKDVLVHARFFIWNILSNRIWCFRLHCQTVRTTSTGDNIHAPLSPDQYRWANNMTLTWARTSTFALDTWGAFCSCKVFECRALTCNLVFFTMKYCWFLLIFVHSLHIHLIYSVYQIFCHCNLYTILWFYCSVLHVCPFWERISPLWLFMRFLRGSNDRGCCSL